ncbi:MAG: amino acid adenylation domain-containing protein, partial [Acidobacteriota bacterium]
EATDKRLVAYVVGKQTEMVSELELRSYLRQRLPEYMIPSTIVMLDSLPLTPNGKIDRRALPVPEKISRGEQNYQEPHTPIEEIVAGIWSEILGIDRISREDNFFDIGGHSLLATQLISRVRTIFDVEIPLRSLFESPTIAELAKSIEFYQHIDAQRGEAFSIARIARDAELPLSFAQHRLWFLDQLQPNNSHYNIPAAIRLEGALDVEALEKSLNDIIERHEVLRTRFETIEDRPVQIIAEKLELKLAVVELSDLSALEREQEVLRLAEEEANRPFNIALGPLLRAQLLRLSEQEYILLLSMHHIVSDGWSISIFVRELNTLYQANCADVIASLPELAIQYADFAAWQRQWLHGEVLEKQFEYWRQQLADAPVLQLPTDRARPVVQTYRGENIGFILTKEISEQLKAVSRQQGTTLFMTLLAVFKVLLARYSRQKDIVVGTPIANRNRTEIEDLIGFFVNTLVLRTMVNEQESFAELLIKIREICLGAYTNQDIPFEKLVEQLNPERNLSHSPLFQIMFILQYAPKMVLEMSGLTLTLLEITSETAKFDLLLTMEESGAELAATITYNTDIFDATTIKRMIGHYQNLLTGLASVPAQQIWKLSMLSEAEQQQILNQWNDTPSDYQADLCVHQLFEKQTKLTPDAIAVVFEEQQLTYQQLNKRANQLGHYLRALGIGPDVLVGICIGHSIDIIVAILGVLKAGGAYLPIDPSYPLERIVFILENAGVTLILTEKQRVDELSKNLVQIVCLDSEWSTINRYSNANPITDLSLDNLAYVIYTSGSTGKPKGVMITHHSVVNYLDWCCQTYPIQSGQAIPLYSSLSFDLTVTSLLLPLVTGQQIVVVRTEEGLTGLKEALSKQSNFSLVKLTPAHLDMLNQQLLATEMIDATRALVIGGEALLAESLTYWRKHSPQTDIFNEYGPTETTVGCSVYQVMAEDDSSGVVSIGRPIANTQLYILDEYHQAVPIGVTGELYIGGLGIARGYLNRPDLTAERFIPNPFSVQPGERLYRTGDLCRYLPDGNIEYLGRIDNQVKIRGFRIELGEIETVLLQQAAVQECVVVVREDKPGDKRLAAYLVSEQEINVSKLRSYLQQQLPDYMIPAAFVFLEAMPLTSNGKLDRHSLPVPEREGKVSRTAYVAPRTAVELELVDVWQKILNICPIGVNDNFFELGGHSLLAVSLMAQIKSRFGRTLPLTTLFQEPTIEKLAILLCQHMDSLQWTPLVKINTNGAKPPFFCIHPIGGEVLCYYELARLLGEDQPFYGLQAAGLIENQEVDTTIEEMATRYINALRDVQPQGPYLLGGWSLGGNIAMEMAQQLENQGEEIDLLALFDSYALLGWELDCIDDAELLSQYARLRRLSITRNDLEGMNIDEQLSYIVKAVRVQDRSILDLDLTQIRCFYNVYKSNLQAARNYTAKTYANQITLFRAEELPSYVNEASSLYHLYQNPTLGWEKFSAKPIKVHTVPGNHENMIFQPYVEVLARQLKHYIMRVKQDNSPMPRDGIA